MTEPRTPPTESPRARTAPEAPAMERRWMVVSAGGRRHRLDLARVREVATARPCTRLPGAPSCVLGLANLRGRVITVVDLAGAMGAPAAPAADGRVVVVAVGQRTLGLAVDEVVGIDRDAGRSRDDGAAPVLEFAALLEPLFG